MNRRHYHRDEITARDALVGAMVAFAAAMFVGLVVGLMLS